MVYIGALKHTKDTIIIGLRAFFANPDNYANLLPGQLPYDVFTKMNIYDSFPEVTLTFPMLIISSSSGRMITPSINNSFASEIYDNAGDLEGYLYGGMYEFSLEIEIGSKSTLEREILMDIVAAAMRFSLRRRMEYHGIIVKEVSYSGENQIQYNADMIYTSTINIQTFSEWFDYYRLLPITSITGNMFMHGMKKPKDAGNDPINYPMNISNKSYKTRHQKFNVPVPTGVELADD